MILEYIKETVRERFCADDSLALDEDELYAVLAEESRRVSILYVSKTTDAVVPVDELAHYVAAKKGDTHPREVTTDEQDTEKMLLRQRHLPQLDAAGVVEWDRNSGVVRGSDDIDALAQFVQDVGSACEGARYQTNNNISVSVSASPMKVVEA